MTPKETAPMHGMMKHRYQLLLVSMGLLYIVYPPLHGFVAGWILYEALNIFLVAVAFLILIRRARRVIVSLGVMMLIASWSRHIVASPALDVAYHLIATTFLALTAAVILGDVARAKIVTREEIAAAIGAYVLIGLTFGHVYCFIDIVQPGAFVCAGHLADELADDVRRYFLLVYFSLSTLTTVSYGDIIPGTDVIRAIAMLEAGVGQFYIAVLISKLVNQSLTKIEAKPDPSK